MLAALRYGLALSVVAIAPGLFLYWFSIHPFIAFWRRLEPRATLLIHASAAAILAVPVVAARAWLPRVEFGTRPVVIALGVVVIEDRELHDRFGAELDRYAARAPRFLPRRLFPTLHMTG